jgi:hypothetical protein
MTLSPKKRFQTEGGPVHVFHVELSASANFHHVLETALVEMQYQESTSPDPVVAAATHHRLAGARAFVHVLLNLSEPHTVKKSDTTTNLNHNL